MMEADKAQAMVDAAVKECKNAIKLQSDNQSPKFSGNESGAVAGGPDRSAANPSGSPGK